MLRAIITALLIRAASRYTQAQLDGDEKLLAAARSDAKAARALDSRAVPDTAAFSPRFRAFYAAARCPGEGPFAFAECRAAGAHCSCRRVPIMVCR